jgi:hypothetical protein
MDNAVDGTRFKRKAFEPTIDNLCFNRMDEACFFENGGVFTAFISSS